MDRDNGIRDGEISDGTVVTCTIPSLPLAPGRYLLTLYVAQASDVLDQIEGQIEFDVLEADFFGTGSLPADTQGPFLVRHHWQLAPKPQWGLWLRPSKRGPLRDAQSFPGCEVPRHVA